MLADQVWETHFIPYWKHPWRLGLAQACGNIFVGVISINNRGRRNRAEQCQVNEDMANDVIFKCLQSCLIDIGDVQPRFRSVWICLDTDEINALKLLAIAYRTRTCASVLSFTILLPMSMYGSDHRFMCTFVCSPQTTLAELLNQTSGSLQAKLIMMECNETAASCELDLHPWPGR